MNDYASLDSPGGPGGVKVVEWNQNQLIRSLCVWAQALPVLIVYTVPGALGGNSMPSNKSSNLNFGIPTPERSWNKNQYQNKCIWDGYLQLGPYYLFDKELNLLS